MKTPTSIEVVQLSRAMEYLDGRLSRNRPMLAFQKTKENGWLKKNAINSSYPP